jgi:hypothetical protein
MNKLLLITALSLSMISCSKYPIVFSKINDNSRVDITLQKDAVFEEHIYAKDGQLTTYKGIYKVQDSILILDYEKDTIFSNKNIVILYNDTFLIMKYNEKYLLFPFVRYLPSITKSDYTKKMMKNIINYYTTNDFESSIGKYNFKFSNGDLSEIYKGTSLISPYYDRFVAIKYN